MELRGTMCNKLVINDTVEGYPTDVPYQAPAKHLVEKRPRHKGQRKHLRDWER
jgi:hypothetical protein